MLNTTMSGIFNLVLFLVFGQIASCHEEPRCSKYDFEEKVLEKVIRFENKIELLTDSMEKIAAKVEDNLDSMQKEIEKLKSDQTNAINQLAESLGAEWKEIKTDFDLLKQDTEVHASTMNETIHSRLNSFKQTFDDLSAQLQQPTYAFSAYDLSGAIPSTGGILVFARTHFNDDGLYSTATGKYTAPVDGIYVFHATLTAYVSNKGIHVEFKAGETAFGRFTVNDKNNFDWSNSGSATARIQKSVVVYMRVTSVSSGYRFRENTYYMCTFSGYRIGP